MLKELFAPVLPKPATMNGSVAPSPDSSGPRVSIVTVTPEMAARWLSKNTDNRKVSPMRAKAIHEDMSEGAFQTTGQGITLGRNECLVDGQKRLMGIISSGKAVDLVVYYDERLAGPRGAMIDRQEPRSEAYIHGKDPRTISVARCMLRLTGSNVITGSARFLRVVAAIEEEMDALMAVVGTKVHSTTRAPIVSAILTLAHDSPHADSVREEYRAFVLNHPEGMSPSVRLLRDWLIRHAGMGRGGKVDMEFFVRTYGTFNPLRKATIARRIYDLGSDRVWAVAAIKKAWGMD